MTNQKVLSVVIVWKFFSKNADFIRHYRIHTDKKPFACQTCNKIFAQKSNLVRHKATHSDEKPFACQICDRKFAHKSTLVQHRSTHSDVRNFKWSVCPDGRSFKTKSQLSHHMVYHYEPKYSCSQCDHKVIESMKKLMKKINYLQ